MVNESFEAQDLYERTVRIGVHYNKSASYTASINFHELVTQRDNGYRLEEFLRIIEAVYARLHCVSPEIDESLGRLAKLNEVTIVRKAVAAIPDPKDNDEDRFHSFLYDPI